MSFKQDLISEIKRKDKTTLLLEAIAPALFIGSLYGAVVVISLLGGAQ